MSVPLQVVSTVPASARIGNKITAEQFTAAVTALISAVGVTKDDGSAVDPTKVTSANVNLTPQGAVIGLNVNA